MHTGGLGRNYYYSLVARPHQPPLPPMESISREQHNQHPRRAVATLRELRRGMITLLNLQVSFLNFAIPPIHTFFLPQPLRITLVTPVLLSTPWPTSLLSLNVRVILILVDIGCVALWKMQFSATGREIFHNEATHSITFGILNPYLGSCSTHWFRAPIFRYSARAGSCRDRFMGCM